jgi:predicted nucleic acid-binding protein
MDFVVDASVAMGWLVRSQATPLTAAARSALADNVGWIPIHFVIEIVRSLRGLERRRVIASEIVDRALERLGTLPLRQDTTNALDLAPTIVMLARRHTLRVADAAYLELALRLQMPLATRDRALARAAESAGATLFRS